MSQRRKFTFLSTYCNVNKNKNLQGFIDSDANILQTTDRTALCGLQCHTAHFKGAQLLAPQGFS